MTLLFGKRSISYQDVWGSGGDTSLIGSSIESALRVVPVYAATSLISDLIATSPMHAYRDLGNGVREKLPTQPKLVTQPAKFGGRITWMTQALSSVLLRGNAVGVILSRDRANTPTTIAWQHPDNVQIDEQGFLPRFFVGGLEVPRSEIVHVPAYVVGDSIVGLSPLRLFRMQIEAGLQAQSFGLDWYRNGTPPSGTLKNSAKTIDSKEADKIKARFRAAVAGNDLFVHGSDWDYKALTVTPADAQFLEQIKATATQIAAVYRVQAEDIGGETGSSLTYSTQELNDIRLSRRALLPWTARFEEALSALMPRPQYLRINLDAGIRADLKTRMEAHDIATRIGVETNDEARALEEKAPLTPEQQKQWQSMYGPRAGANQELPGGKSA